MGLTSSKTIIPIKEADAKLGPVLRMRLDKVRMQRSVAFSGGCLFFAACICGLYPQLQAVLAFASRMRRVNPRALRYALAATDWRESTSRGSGIVLSCACPTVFVITSKKHPPSFVTNWTRPFATTMHIPRIPLVFCDTLLFKAALLNS